MSELIRDIPAYISHKRSVADDGERVTIVEFEYRGSPTQMARPSQT
jgi:hypothetical protein